MVGIALAPTTLGPGLGRLNPFQATPIAKRVALILAILVTATFVLALVLYHRPVDGHEERAYLWGSQVAYYFLILAFPVWWLFERSAIVGPLTLTPPSPRASFPCWFRALSGPGSSSASFAHRPMRVPVRWMIARFND